MQHNKRAGFTLVELMVAMALTLFIMVILSQAFVSSLETFAAMKGIGDMQQNLRTAGNLLKNDLSQNHLDGDRRLSDVNASGASPLVKFPNQSGFFAILQQSQVDSTAAYVTEGFDSNGVPSYRAVDHVLYMTVRRKGNRSDSFFPTVLQDSATPTQTLAKFFGQQSAYNMDPSISLPAATLTPPYVSPATQGVYSSQWAEVAYFLVRTGSTEEPNNPASLIGTPTFGLYRAVFVMVPNGTKVNTLFTAPAYSIAAQTLLSQGVFAGLSTSPSATGLQFNTPDTAALGQRVIPSLTPTAFSTLLAGDARFSVGDASGATQQYSSNLVLPNVLSFQIQVMPAGTLGFVDLPTTNVPTVKGLATQLFDTTLFSNNAYSNNFALKGIQITLRVFDPASRQSRQMTIVQDL